MSDRIEDLVERVRKATGPDYELDPDILAACGMLINPKAVHRDYGRWPDEAPPFYRIPHVTGSIDAALALVERVLPGRDIDLELRETMIHGAVLRVTDAIIYPLRESGGGAVRGYGNSPPLAIILALLTCLDASKGSGRT